jgi:hypothetical protein
VSNISNKASIIKFNILLTIIYILALSLTANYIFCNYNITLSPIEREIEAPKKTAKYDASEGWYEIYNEAEKYNKKGIKK